jgi:voltage-gated potassium channel Kch
LNIDVRPPVIGSIDIRFKVLYKLRNMVESEIAMPANTAPLQLVTLRADAVITSTGLDGVGTVEGTFVGVIMGGSMAPSVSVASGSADEVSATETATELVVSPLIPKLSRVCVDLGSPSS